MQSILKTPAGAGGLITDLSPLLPRGDALIVVPPFAALELPSLAAHLLQACAREAGFEVRVLYLNLMLAAAIGEDLYREVFQFTCCTPLLAGERLFSAAADYEADPFGSYKEERSLALSVKACTSSLTWSDLERLASWLCEWMDAVALGITDREFKVVGSTTSFEQTSASIALLDRVKRLRPQTVTVLGGSNCEGEMAEGIASLQAPVDFIFSGESEASWPDFLSEVLSGRLPSTPIILGRSCESLDRLPLPEYREFMEQLALLLPGSSLPENLWLPYESSRGCWWGEKSHCTFCGLNGEQMRFREKSPDRIIADVRRLVTEHGCRRICMADNIMPHSYFQTLVPRLADELPGLYFHYEQKANLSLAKVLALKRAGVAEIQPGIEALSSSLLARMKKGVSAAQNIALLRYGRSVGMFLKWNLLFDFPGDQVTDYEQTLMLIPFLCHLNPPHGVGMLVIDRFSPYFNRPSEYGIGNVRPWQAYKEVFPEGADLWKLAYHFEGDYESTARSNPDVLQKIAKEIEVWRGVWEEKENRPTLWIHRMAEDLFLLQDTRGLPGTQEIQFLTWREASAALVSGHPLSSIEVVGSVERRTGLFLEDRYVPLATAEPELLLEFEREMAGSLGRAAQTTQAELSFQHPLVSLGDER